MSARQFRHFVQTTKTTQPGPQVSSVNGSKWQIIEPMTLCWRHRFHMTVQPLVMVNYVCGFTQSETRKYFEWIIMAFIISSDQRIKVGLRILRYSKVICLHWIISFGSHCSHWQSLWSNHSEPCSYERLRNSLQDENLTNQRVIWRLSISFQLSSGVV